MAWVWRAEVNITPYEVATRFLGIKEVQGIAANPMILAMLKLDNPFVQGDEVPWCSAFVNYVAWLMGLCRSKSLAARSWLQVGQQIDIDTARSDSDIVILQRGTGEQPGPEVIHAPGHVGFFSGKDNKGSVFILGGNQGDEVSIKPFPVAHILGIRRLT
jgi:uncharacterized protein (TIGR02594 family)